MCVVWDFLERQEEDTKFQDAELEVKFRKRIKGKKIEKKRNFQRKRKYELISEIFPNLQLYTTI